MHKATGKRYSFTTLRNNRTVDYIHGSLEEFKVTYSETQASLMYNLTFSPGNEPTKDMHKSCFVLDNGAELKLYYVGGYSQDKSTLFLYPITAGATRYMGAGKTYFLSITESEHAK